MSNVPWGKKPDREAPVKPRETTPGDDERPPDKSSADGEGLSRRGFIGVSLAYFPAMAFVAASLRAAEATRGASLETAIPSVPVSLLVNGQEKKLFLDSRMSLLHALRNELGLTGAKEGCDHGQCGACTVLIDGRRTLSCLTLGVAASGRPITTIEGLAEGERLHPVQAAFLEHDGFQCGYCTPGQIVSAVGLLSEGCSSDPIAIRECMSGNICRCGAYPNIVAAVRAAQGARA
jgi:xanthine dehydrogenase YagT iron-sulfur-binding subunit